LKKLIGFLLIANYSIHAFTLQEGFQKSLVNNSEVQVRENELKKIKYDIDIANGLMYPSLDLVGNVNNNRKSTNSYTPQNGNVISQDEYSLNVTQPLYDGLESAYQQQLQKNRFQSAQYYLKEAQNNLALTYTQNYINALKTKDMLSLSSESYQISEDIYNKTVKKVERGFGTKLEFERAKANLEESGVNLAIDKLSLNDAMQALFNNVQEKFDSNELVKPTFTYNLPHTEEEALSYALVNHPSMLVSFKNVEVAMSEQKRDLKSFHPEVNLVGTYQLNDAAHKEKGVNVSNEYQVGIQLAYNLYNGGKDDASNQKMLQTIKEKKILIQKSNQEISNRLALAWNSYVLNEEKLGRLQQFLKTRRYVLDTTYEEFNLGTKDLGSLIDAHLDYISTKRSMISATYDLLLAHFRVLEATGILSDELLSDKREEIWGKNKIDIEQVVKKNTEELTFSYTALEDKNKKQEAPKLEYLEENKVNEDLLASKTQTAPLTSVEPKIQSKELSFKEVFLSASEDKYSVNMATFSTMENAIRFMKENNITNQSFAFLFGQDEQYYKVMYGVFDTYQEAKEAIQLLSKEIRNNNPRIEPIHIKQNLFKKYNENE
jgi:adhesin transport system outer membrane protein